MFQHRGRRMGLELNSSISDDTASQQSGFMVGNSHDRQSLSSGKDLYTNQRFAFVKAQLKK